MRVETDNQGLVDEEYAEFARHCKGKMEEFVETTPFDRRQLYDLYTKFKALAKFSVSNRDKAYIRSAKQELKKKRRTGGDTPKRKK